VTHPVDTEAPLDRTPALEAVAEDHARALRLCPPGLLEAYSASVSPLSDAVRSMTDIYLRHQEASINKERRHAEEKQLLRDEIEKLRKMLDEANATR